MDSINLFNHILIVNNLSFPLIEPTVLTFVNIPISSVITWDNPDNLKLYYRHLIVSPTQLTPRICNNVCGLLLYFAISVL